MPTHPFLVWNQSSDPISPDERTLLFNDVVKKQRGLLGANTLYQIVCYNAPELET
jgi:hypothetical protein